MAARGGGARARRLTVADGHRTTAAASITVRVPLAIRRRPGRKTVVTPVRDGGEEALPTRADPALVKALARAFRYQRLLDEGRYASISEMAAAEKLDRGYLGRVLQLTLLAPDIVEAILDGRQPGGLTLSSLLEPFPFEWVPQRDAERPHPAHERRGGLP
jgi:hypothetical protein